MGMSDFKVRDLVVFDTTKPFCGQMPNYLMEYVRASPNCEHDVLVWIGETMFEVGGKAIRLATQEEIKAGHRIELSGNTGELEVLIPSNSTELDVLDMVDVPPTTIVVDL